MNKCADKNKSVFIKNHCRPIVVTDSGAGGLWVLHKLARAFPGEKFIYYSDVKNVPYGNKPTCVIEKYCAKRVAFAKKHNATLLTVACNTMSVVGKNVFENSGINVIKVVAADCFNNKKTLRPIIMFCTAATAKNGDISRLSGYNGVKICPMKDLAKEIEGNIYRLKSFKPDFMNNDYGKFKTVVLGCTHYALIRDKFEEKFGEIKIIDGSENLIEEAGRVIKKSASKNKSVERSCAKKNKAKQVLFYGSGARKMRRVYYLLFGNE